jgi:hypothetical protein
MSVNGVNGRNFGGNQQPQNSGMNSDGAGKEFALEKQRTGLPPRADGVKSHDVSGIRPRTTTIAGKGQRNRKGAPRTVLVDGQIYEIYLLAIA